MASDFDQIVESYMAAARILMLSRAHVEMAVFKARRLDHHCASCRWSRAPHDAETIARLRGVLAIFTRRCIRKGVYRTCPQWQEIEVPAEVLEAA